MTVLFKKTVLTHLILPTTSDISLKRFACNYRLCLSIIDSEALSPAKCSPFSHTNNDISTSSVAFDPCFDIKFTPFTISAFFITSMDLNVDVDILEKLARSATRKPLSNIAMSYLEKNSIVILNFILFGMALVTFI